MVTDEFLEYSLILSMEERELPKTLSENEAAYTQFRVKEKLGHSEVRRVCIRVDRHAEQDDEIPTFKSEGHP